MVTTTTGLATSFITFTRTSNATVTDSNGFIEWAGHNLLTNSESFDAASWVKSSATVTANTDPAPNGTTTGDTIAASGANGTALQTWTAEAVPYTFGVWLRRKTGTGNIQIAADSGTYTTVTITSSWALYTVTQTPAAGSKSAGIRIVTSGDEVYAWGAHLYRSDLGGMVLNPARGDAYYPTTPRNLLGFTEDANSWTKNEVTVTSNATVAPNGLNTADKVYVNNGSMTGPWAGQSVSVIVGTPYTYSIYLKKSETRYANVAFWFSPTKYAGLQFDFDALAITRSAAAGSTYAVTTADFSSVGNDWYRVRLLGTVGDTTAYPSVVGTNTLWASGAPIVAQTGNGSDGVFVWGAQLSDSASLDAYSPVYGAAVTSAAYYAPRLDYDANGSALGLLVEEQRTNLLTHTAAFDNGDWTKSGTSSITADTTVAPDGTTTADTLTGATGDPAVAVTDTLARTPTVSPSTAYTASLYVRGIAGTTVKLLLRDGSTGVTASTTATLTSSWQRISCTLTSGASTTAFSYRVGSTNGTIAIWGAQFEAGSFATSYIPNGSAVAGATRTADVASVSTQAFPYSQTEGTVVVAYDRIGVNRYSRLFNLGDASENNQVSLLNFNVGQENAYFVTGGSAAGVVAGPSIPSVNAAAKMGLAFKSGDSAISLNGASATAISSTFTPAATSLYMGGTPVSGQYLNGHVRQITYLPRRLPNADLQARTV